MGIKLEAGKTEIYLANNESKEIINTQTQAENGGNDKTWKHMKYKQSSRQNTCG